MRKSLERFLPKREQILKSRCLGRFTHLLHRHELWHFHRRSLAGGLALGLFVGSMPLIGHIPLALIGALWLRVNIPVAFGAVMLTNPLTMPAYLYFAFRLGLHIRSWLGFAPESSVAMPLMDLIHNWQLLFTDGGQRIWDAYLTIWLGSLLIGVLAAVAGYYLSLLIWRLVVTWRWRHRHRS